MRINFETWAWKDIMQRAGGFITPFEHRDRLSLNYIHLICEADICTAFASDADGYTYCAMRVPCKMNDKYTRISFLVKPEKVPAKAISVSVYTPDIIEGVYTITIHYYIIGSAEATVTESIQRIPDEIGTIPAFEKHLDGLINKQEQKYFISFRLDVLQRALSAFKGREKDCGLVFHFGTCVQPAFIDVYENGWPETRVAICPNRIFNYDGGIRK